MPDFSEWENDLIERNRVARLATVDENNNPHVVVIVYAFDGKRFFTPIDDKPKKVPYRKLRRIRNIENNKAVSLLIDEYSEDWSMLAWVQIRGRAEIIESGKNHSLGVKLLNDKYEQYADMNLEGKPMIIIYPVKIASWRAADHINEN